MRGGGRWRAVLVAVIVFALLFGIVSFAYLFRAPSGLPETPAVLPCPNIRRSSAQTVSTSLPAHIEFSPCPGIVAGTFLGGSNSDGASDVAVDATGNIYVTGGTTSPDFRTTPGAYDTTFNGVEEGFLVKFNPSGALVFSTFLGGSSGAWSVALDSLGGVYVTGGTSIVKFDSNGALVYSTLLPGQIGVSSIAADPSGNVYATGSLGGVFVGKLNPEGSQWLYSTVIGGKDGEPFAIAVDALGNAYVTGIAGSPDFPVTSGAFDSTFNPPWPEEWQACCPYDGFLFKLNPEGTALVYSTFLGGFDVDAPAALTADSLGNVHVLGSTWSMDFPVTPGAYNTSLTCRYWDLSRPDYPGCEGASFLAGFDPSGELVYGTFFPAAVPWGIDSDESGNVYFTGDAEKGFPTTPGAYDRTPNGGRDAFVAKMDSKGTLLYSTLLGGGDHVFVEAPEPGLIGDDDDSALSVAIDPTGNATVVGGTGSIDFPVPEGAYDTTYNGRGDAFVIRVEPIPDPNRAPYAHFEVVPSEFTAFVSASGSADADDLDDLLAVRWDWEDDGAWDTGWSTAKTAGHVYAAPDAYTIRLEVRDTGGLANNVTRQVLVPGPQAVEMVWTHQFGTPTDDVARGIVVDASGVYVGGRTSGAFPGQTNAGSDDVFLRRYDPGGGEIWTRQFGSSEFDILEGLAVDASDLYVTAYGGVLPGQTDPGLVLRKYDLGGNEKWTRVLGDVEGGVFVHASGVYVGGVAHAVLPGQTSAGGADAFVRKFDRDGNEIWTRQFGSSEYDGGTILVDGSGVYVVGFTFGTLSGQTENFSPDRFVRKYDLDGNHMWTRQFGTSTEDVGGGAALDASGLYLAGYTFGTLPGQTGAGRSDAYIRKYDPNGNELWTHQFGTSRHEWDVGLVLDASGVSLVGNTDGTFSGQTSAGGVFVRRYDLSGNELWTRQTESARVLGVAGDPSGLYVAVDTRDGFSVLKYDLNGILAWPEQVIGGAITGGIATDATGVYVAGVAEGVLPGQNSAGGRDAFVAKLTQPASNGPPVLGTIHPVLAVGPTAQEVLLTVSVSDPGGDVLSYSWDFGDGTSAKGTTPAGGGTITATHTYEVAATYAVSVTVTDAAGETATDSIQLVVPGPPPPPGIPPLVMYGVPTAVALGLGAVLLWQRRLRKGPPSG